MEKSPEKSHLKLSFKLMALLLGLMLLLTGCGGKKEVEELFFVLGVGVDLGKEEGTYVITLQMADPKISGGGGAEIGNLTVSIETDSLAEVQDKLNESLEKQPFMGTVRIFVIGEELARSGLNDAIDLFQRFSQFRRSAYLLVAKGEAKEVLSATIQGKDLPALSLLETIEGQKHFSVFPVTRLGHYLTILGRDGQRPLIPLVEVLEKGEHGITYQSNEKGGRELTVHEAGVFQGGMMKGVLSDEESKGYLWLDDQVNSRIIFTEVMDGIKISCRIVDTKTKYKVEEINGQIGIRFIIDARGVIREIWGQKQTFNNIEWQDFLKACEPYVSQAIQKECEAAIAKSKKLQLDFVGIGRKIEVKKPKYWQQVRDNWEEQLLDIPIVYEIMVDIEHAGFVRNSPSSIEDK